MINLGNIEIADLRLGSSQVKAVYVGNEQVWSGEQPPAPVEVYAVCFENVGSTEGTVGWTTGIYSSARYLNLQYSFDGQSWNSLPISEKPAVPAGRKIYIRAGETGQNNFTSDLGANYAARFQLTGSEFKVSGEMLSLLKQTPITQFTSQNNRAFAYAFYSCDKLVDASQLVMPDFSIDYECYNMFQGCTSLTAAPATLPATTLANFCYNNMFKGCTSLTTAPSVLPATTLASNCCQNMFQNCTSLTAAPALPATTLASNCYANMFQDCTSLSVPSPELPATTLTDNCYGYMFQNCSSLTAAPAISGMTLATNCCQNMFQNCTSLSGSVVLPATTLVNNCYGYMFQQCKLDTIEVHFTADWGMSNTGYWVYGIASGGTFKCPTALGTNETITRDVSNCPAGWTVVNIDAA